MTLQTLFLLAAALSLGTPAFAQFHTITADRCQTRQQKGTPAETDVPNDHEPVIVPTQEEWVGRFASVSYPLRNVFVTSPYGYRRDPFTSKRAFHNGLDLRANAEPVYAMLSGDVVKTGQDPRSGKYITLRHGSLQISYCHLSRLLVSVGTSVHAGDPVAVTGNTGRSTAPHLHITCKDSKGKPLNPLALLDFITNTRSSCVSELTASR